MMPPESGNFSPLPKLSPITRRVVDLIVHGHSAKGVAALTGKSQATIAYHLRRAADAWGLNRAFNLRVQLARRVAEDALTHLLIARAEALRDTGSMPSFGASLSDDDELSLFLASFHDPWLKAQIRRTVDGHTGAARQAAVAAVRRVPLARLGPTLSVVLAKRYTTAIAQAVANIAAEPSPVSPAENIPA
jgi:hypothetical protein